MKLGFGLALPLLGIVTYDVSADDSLKSTLSQNWMRLHEMDLSPKRYLVETDKIIAGRKLGKHEYEVSIGTNCGKRVGKRNVWCWNSQYAFVLKRGEEEFPWNVVGLDLNDQGKNGLRKGMLTNAFDGNCFYPLTWFYQDTCLAYLQSGQLSLGSSRKMPDGKLRIDIVLRANFVDESRPEKVESFSGHIIVDPLCHYVIVEAVINRTTQEPRAAKHMPLERRYEAVGDHLDVNFIMHSSESADYLEAYRFKTIETGRIADHAFRLSYYNLPEPMGVMWEKPTPRYVWILVAGAITAALAVAARYAYRLFEKKGPM